MISCLLPSHQLYRPITEQFLPIEEALQHEDNVEVSFSGGGVRLA